MADKQTVEFEQLASKCCGLDIHKKEIVATVDGEGLPKETRTFSSTTRSLTELKDWLLELGVSHVAMESTGVYWKPVMNILELGGPGTSSMFSVTRQIRRTPHGYVSCYVQVC